MIARNFQPNKVLKAMTYTAGSLKVIFCKGQEREYYNVPPAAAYALFYSKTAADSLQVYSTKIKGKFQVLNVKNI